MVNERKYVKQHQLKKNRNSQAKIDVIQECPNAQIIGLYGGLFSRQIFGYDRKYPGWCFLGVKMGQDFESELRFSIRCT